MNNERVEFFLLKSNLSLIFLLKSFEGQSPERQVPMKNIKHLKILIIYVLRSLFCIHNNGKICINYNTDNNPVHVNYF